MLNSRSFSRVDERIKLNTKLRLAGKCLLCPRHGKENLAKPDKSWKVRKELHQYVPVVAGMRGGHFAGDRNRKVDYV